MTNCLTHYLITWLDMNNYLYACFALKVQMLHKRWADFHDPPLNSIKAGEDAKGLPVYAGTRYDKPDSTLRRPLTIIHDGSHAWMPSFKSGFVCYNRTAFHFVVLQIGMHTYHIYFVVLHNIDDTWNWISNYRGCTNEFVLVKFFNSLLKWHMYYFRKSPYRIWPVVTCG